MKKLFIILLLIFIPLQSYAQYQKYILSVRPELKDINPERVSELSYHVENLSNKYYVDPYLILSIIKIETHFRNVKGDKNLDEPACSYMQIRPSTFEKVMHYKTNCENLIYDWKVAVEASVKYFKSLRDRHGTLVAISRYNGGNRNLDYVYKVLRAYHKFKGDLDE